MRCMWIVWHGYTSVGQLTANAPSTPAAAARAVETEQPDALYRDPLAEALAGAEAMTYARRISQTPDPKVGAPVGHADLRLEPYEPHQHSQSADR